MARYIKPKTKNPLCFRDAVTGIPIFEMRYGGIRPPVLIYAFADPEDVNLLRYIGKTENLYHRLAQHMGNARGIGAAPVACWIRTLLAAGKEPHIRVLEVTDHAHCFARERAHIHAHAGSGALLNIFSNPLIPPWPRKNGQEPELKARRLAAYEDIARRAALAHARRAEMRQQGEGATRQ